MKKFVNHVDHVAWISRPENLDANLARLEALADAKLQRMDRPGLGFTVCISWEAGLEVITPMGEPTDFNRALTQYLDTLGEGVLGVVFGVKDLEAHKARVEALGFQAGPEMPDQPDAPWRDKLKLTERIAGTVMNSWFVLGDIDYADDVIAFG